MSLFDLSRGTKTNTIHAGSFYLNEKIRIDYANTNEAAHCGIFGITGCGKSYDLGLILSQLPNALWLDPKGDAVEVLRAMGATTGENGDWEQFTFGKNRSGKNNVVINAAEISSLNVNVICEGESENRKRIISFMLEKWDSLSKSEKTFDGFKELFHGFKQELLFNDLASILDSGDDAPEIDFYMTGRKLIDIVAINKSSKALGLFLDIVFQHRNQRSVVLGIGVDEINAYFTEQGTPMGKALINLYAMGRSKKIIAICAGQNYGGVPKDVKLNMRVYLLADLSLDMKRLKQFGIPQEVGVNVAGVLLNPKVKGEVFFWAPVFDHKEFSVIRVSNWFFVERNALNEATQTKTPLIQCF